MSVQNQGFNLQVPNILITTCIQHESVSNNFVMFQKRKEMFMNVEKLFFFWERCEVGDEIMGAKVCVAYRR